MLYSIGEFAKRTGLTARALRLYDERGLLPARRDPTNDHRYYSDDDLHSARRIALLRTLGFSLPDITDLLAGLGHPEEKQQIRLAFHGQIERCQAKREASLAQERNLRATLRLLDAPSPDAHDLTRLAVLQPLVRRDLMNTYRTTSARFLVQGPRDVQQDVAHQDPERGLYAVADGFGTQGLEAAQAAVDTFLAMLDPAQLEPARWSKHLHGLVQAAHARVTALDGGTTLSVLVIHNGVAFIAHVGDSRVYRATNTLVPLTWDHTLLQAQLDRGEDPAARDPRDALLLTHAVGMEGPLDDVQVHREDITSGVRYLLATDGLTRVMDDEALFEIVQRSPTVDAAGRALSARSGQHDNAAVIVVDPIA